MLTVSVQALQVGLSTAVVLEVGHDHIGVAAAQVLGDFVEVLAVPAALQEVQSGVCNVVAHDEGVGVIAHLLEVVDLGGQHTEDELVLLAGGVGDLDVCAVQSTQRDGTVQHELHVAGTGSLGACQRDLLRDLGCGHQVLAQGDTVLFQIDHAQLLADSGVVVDEVAQLADHADHLLGHIVAGSSLCAEDIGLGDEVGVGVLLQVQVLSSDVQRIQVLALVLVHTLDLAVEDGAGVDDLTGALLEVSGKVLLVVQLDLIQTLQDGLVLSELVQLGQVGGVVLVAGADGLVQQLAQLGVGGQQPAAVSDAVGHVLESLGLEQVVVVEDALLDDLAVELGDAVDAVGGVGADVGHAHLIVADEGHIVDLALVAGEGCFQLLAGAAVHLDHDLVDAGQGHLEDVHIPLLQSLGHDGVVGVGEDLLADVEALVPAEAALIQQDAHHLGDGEGRMGIVQLDSHLVGQVLEGAVGGQMALDDVADGGSRQEVLLAQAEDLALDVVVVGVQHLGDELGAGVLAHCGVVVAQREAGHIEVGSLGLPQTQLCNALAVVTLNVHIRGDGHDAVVVGVLDIVEAMVPVLVDLAVEADFHSLIGVALEPDLTAGQPVVGALLLPAVHDLLLEDAVLVQDGVAGAADASGGHAVQIAGGQTAQAAVAQTCVRLFLVDAVQADVSLGQSLLGSVIQAQIEQAHLEAAAHQELHAQVVHLLGAGADGLGLELLMVLAHHLAADEGQSAVDLLMRCNAQVNTIFAGELVLKNFCKFFCSHK